MTNYTWGDRLEDLRYDLYMNWLGRFAPLTSVRVIAAVANAARLVGATRLSQWLVAWAWDIADIPMSSAAFDLHRKLLPWAWSDGRLAWWCYKPQVFDIIAMQRGGAR
jgi:hypothetical protein